MSLGQLARRLLGRHFRSLGRWYRAVFVDLDALVSSLPEMPAGSRVLDIGGGDGEVLARLLGRFPGVTATLIDLAPAIGGSLDARQAERVTVLPATSIAAYRALQAAPSEFILVSDVLHHVPPPERARFFAELRELVGRRATTLVVKDVEPGHWRARLGYLADVYVSGDRNVRLIGRAEMTELVRSSFGAVPVRETALFRLDRPNYALVFSLAARPG